MITNILNMYVYVFHAPLSGNVSGYTALYKYKLLLIIISTTLQSL